MRGGSSSCARHTQNAALPLRPCVCEQIPAHTLPAPLLPQLGPNVAIFIVKRVVGGGFVVVVVIFLGTREGLTALAALSDVLMIYRHSLGKAGILLPGSLKKLCTGSLCSAGLGDGGEKGDGARGFGGSPPPPPFPEPEGDECAAPFGGSVCAWSCTESPSQGLQLLSYKFSLCLYIHKGSISAL